jgi:beta-lactam-binding protein with PASTA domain
LATFFFLAVMAGVGYYVFMEALDGGQHVTVPSIEGMSITKASYLLAEQGLELGKPIPVPHPSVPEYHVITQRPAAGHVVRTGRKIIPTVSQGADFLTAPDLTRLTLDDARRNLAQSRFRIGTVARIPHKFPRDMVLAQDPPANADLPQRGAIHLLVSGGVEREGAFMPDIRGMKVDEVMQALAPYEVIVVPREVDMPDAEEDVVLDQDPAPNALIHVGQMVTYKVRASGRMEIPDARYVTTVRHTMNYDWYDRDVKVDVLGHRGNRKTWFSVPPLFDAQSVRDRVRGSVITLSVTYVEEAMVEVYVNGEQVESYQLKNGADPVRRGSAL